MIMIIELMVFSNRKIKTVVCIIVLFSILLSIFNNKQINSL